MAGQLGGRPILVDDDDMPVQVVDAGGPQDRRRLRAGQPALLRLGAAFLARHPSLWNFPARILTLL